MWTKGVWTKGVWTKPFLNVIRKWASADGGRRDVFLFHFGTATNVWFDGCAFQQSSVKKDGGRQAAKPRRRPPQTRNDHDPPHTAEGSPQARQAAAYPIRCSFHLLPILVYRKAPSKRPAVAKNRDKARQAAVKYGTTMTRRLPRKGRLRPGNVQLLRLVGVSVAAIAGSLWNQHHNNGEKIPHISLCRPPSPGIQDSTRNCAN